MARATSWRAESAATVIANRCHSTASRHRPHSAKAIASVSATPADYERNHSEQIVEQLIRPTGLLDPEVEVRGTDGQIDDLVAEIRARTARGERTLVTTLTKKMSEDLADYLREVGIKTYYLHSEQDAFQRVEVLRDLRLGVFDCVVGINLLREGLDLPEVSLVAVLDADKEGFLRNESTMVQTIGRAARHINAHAILYADRITDSMRLAIDETHRRRTVQAEYNQRHNIAPASISKEIRDITDQIITEQARQVAEDAPQYDAEGGAPLPADAGPDQITRLIKELEARMKQASRDLEFEKAAVLRDQIIELRRELAGDPEQLEPWVDQAYGRRRRPRRRRESAAAARGG